MKKKKKVALTMFFVFFPIDVLFLDRDKRVVEIKKNFRPFTNYYPRKEALYIVELPIGLLKNTRLGDRIAITSL